MEGADGVVADGVVGVDHLREGSAAYIAGEYKKAIPPYQKALDLEKQQRKLERKLRLLENTLVFGFEIQNPQSKIQNRKADSSFEKFRDSDKLKKAIAEMKSTNRA